MKISINEPCHENWDAMTPNDKGAFCKSCAKDVVDFSKMGIAEIKSFFSKPQGKVCGRFEEKQLQELTFDDFFAKFTYWNFTKKFAVIFFMAFGFWIFSNASAFAQNNRNMMKGEVMCVPDRTPKKEIPKNHDNDIVNGKRMIKGKIAKHEPVTTVEPQQMMMGMVAIRPQTQKVVEPVIADTLKNEDAPFIEDNLELTNTVKTITGDTVVTIDIEEIKTLDNTIKGNATVTNYIEPINTNDYMIKGDVICTIEKVVEHKEPTTPVLIDPVPEVTKIDSIARDVNPIKDISSQTIIYPNPSKGNFLIETNILTKQTVTMLDENGRIVLSQNITGTSNIDASALRAGIYTVLIKDNSSDAIEKKRIVIVK